MLNTLQNLATYNQWANERVLRMLGNNISVLPAGCLELFSHIVNAQAIWLSRIQKIKNARLPFDENTLAACRELHITTSEELFKLTNQEPTALDEIMIYTNTKGEPFETTIHDILIQVFNHGTYHRGQIARSLRQGGLEPVNTDYITFVREK